MDTTDFPLISTTTADHTIATEMEGCDRLEYTYSSYGSTYLRIIPAGVCFLRSTIGSEMLVCGDSSTMRGLKWYDSDECEGEVSGSRPVAERVDHYDNVSISITCCTGNQCPYVDVVVYNFDGISNCTNSDDLDINDGDVNHFLSDGPFVIGSCEYRNYDSTTYQCSEGRFIQYEYEDNLECQGTADDTVQVSSGDCYVYSFITKIHISQVICGTAIDTCGIYGSTTTNTPTTLASTTTTIDVTKIEPECDRVEYVSESTHKYLKIIPAGVCYKSYYGSKMLVCDGPNTMKKLSWWYNDECQGDMPYSETIQESSDISNLSVHCCTGNQCPYVNVLVYDFYGITDCSNPDNLNIAKDGDLDWFSSEGPYVIDSCGYTNRDNDDSLDDKSTLYQCLNSTFIAHEYEDNLNCNGEIHETEMISDGDCHVVSSANRTQISTVTCGVAIDTCATTTDAATSSSETTEMMTSTQIIITKGMNESSAIIFRSGIISCLIFIFSYFVFV